MKHIKLFENFDKKSFIDEFCFENYIKNYTINEDGSIDVNDNVALQFTNLNGKLPIKFNMVQGYFRAISCNLTTLEGFPEYVGGELDFSKNEIKSFEYTPKHVNGNYICDGNKISEIDEFIKDVKINGTFFAKDNLIENLNHNLPDAKDGLELSHNLITSLKGLNTDIRHSHLNLSYNKIEIIDLMPNCFKYYLDVSNNPLMVIRRCISLRSMNIVMSKTPFQNFNNLIISCLRYTKSVDPDTLSSGGTLIESFRYKIIKKSSDGEYLFDLERFNLFINEQGGEEISEDDTKLNKIKEDYTII